MPKIKSFSLYTPKGNPLKATWESFNSLSIFTRFMVIIFFLFVLSTPFIANNPQIFYSRAQTEPSETNTQENNIQDNIYSLCDQFKSLEVEEEVSCKDAIDNSLNIYSGKITDIVMANKVKFVNQPASNEGIKAWRITIALNKPVERDREKMQNVRLTLDRSAGIVVSEYFFN